MKIVIHLACLVILSSAINTEFEAFKSKFGKIYKNVAEEELRQQIFEDNVKLIAEHNALHKQGKVSFDLAINRFADLTAKEFAAQYNNIPQSRHSISSVAFVDSDPVPDSIDWRDTGCVSSVKDQGQCGSACAFSAVGAVEGQYCVATGTPIGAGFSVNRISDCCSIISGMSPCSGCFMDDIYSCLVTLTDRGNASYYPSGQKNEVCGADELTGGAVVTGYVDVPSKSEDALKNTTGTIGPVSAAIDASHASFQLYNSGVYYEPACSENILDHGVLIVGYGGLSGTEYWLVKNSWGVSWGEQGYIMMSRNKDNNCGIATEASYPVLEV